MTFIGFCRRKLNKGKLDQINSELAQMWYSNYQGPKRTTYQIAYRLHWVSNSGLLSIHNIFASVYQTLS